MAAVASTGRAVPRPQTVHPCRGRLYRFENSVREEGLLAVALGGIIFGPGNGGTVQEIFQDACQNYYRTYEQVKSPMILFRADYWDPTLAGADPHAKPVLPLLDKLAREKGFDNCILLTSDPGSIVEFIKKHAAKLATELEKPNVK